MSDCEIINSPQGDGNSGNSANIVNKLEPNMMDEDKVHNIK